MLYSTFPQKHSNVNRSGRQQDTRQLERTLSLSAALTIGVGTMVGAGIFVFPGIAAGHAGPAATLSFALGAVVALLVALPASELATAIPRSGGAYYFVRIGLGPSWGALVGLSQWLGLIFAAAFYLTGFGSYALRFLDRVGVSALPSWAIAALLAAALTLLHLTGAKNTGRLQKVIVGALLLILGVFLVTGLAGALGLVGDAPPEQPFAPFGVGQIFTTTALIFTSYLGFVQIANVAGEIRNPARNLPLAMVGSVLIVGVLYVGTVYVSTTVLGNQRLAELGPTAIIAVSESLLGQAGAVIMLGAGLLATLSSANASLLSSSRSVFALGREGVVPEAAGRISRRFGSPYVSLLTTGALTGGLALLGRVEILAEVASLLHLLIYALLCFTAVRMRGRAGYEPSFRAPGYPVLPLLAGAACVGLAAFMQPLSLAIGGGVLAFAGAWYAFVRAVRDAGPETKDDA